MIIDVQHAICVGAEAAFDIDNVVDRINQVSERARAAGVPVILIQHEESEGPFQYGAAGWQIFDKVVTQPDDIRVRKTTPDSFFKTDLQSILQARGIQRLVACGLQSDFCVDSTVRGALAHGYPVILVSDGHSTLDNRVLKAPQITAHHNETLANLCSFGPRVRLMQASEIVFD